MPDDSILLFRLGGLGDLLIALPSIFFVRKKNPRARVTLVGRPECAELLKSGRVVDEVESWEKREFAALFARAPGLNGSGASLQDRYSLALGWMQGASGAEFEARLQSLGTREAHFIAADLSSRVPLSRFFFDRTRAILDREGLAEIHFDDCAKLPIPDSRPISQTAPKFAVIHPGSGSEFKRWPLHRFLEIVRRLSERGFSGLIVTGEAEAKLRPELQRTVLSGGWKWIDRLPLPELASWLAGASIYLGNDSGVTHLAAACGTAVVALFLREFESLWRPYGRTCVLSASAISEIPPALVWEAISGLIGSV